MASVRPPHRAATPCNRVWRTDCGPEDGLRWIDLVQDEHGRNVLPPSQRPIPAPRARCVDFAETEEGDATLEWIQRRLFYLVPIPSSPPSFVIMPHGLALRLATALQTSDSVCTGWPTPTKADCEGGPDRVRRDTGNPKSQLKTIAVLIALANADTAGWCEQPSGELSDRQRAPHRDDTDGRCDAVAVANARGARRRTLQRAGEAHGRQEIEPNGHSDAGELGHASGAGPSLGSVTTDGRQALRDEGPPAAAPSPHGSDWIICSDGKARSIKPGTFPLAHGYRGRVGMLRAAGNAINKAQAEQFIEAALGAIGECSMNARAAIAHNPNDLDPILAETLAAFKAREVFPTGHEISYERDSDERGRAVAVARCECGSTFRLLASREAELDAQVEAHWQRFDHVEDRGQPVSEEVSRNDKPAEIPDAGHQSASEKEAVSAGDRAEPDNAPRENESQNLSALPESERHAVPPAALPEPAGAQPSPAPASAGSPSLDENDDSWMLRLAETLAWRDEDEPVVTARIPGPVDRESLTPGVTLYTGNCLDALSLPRRGKLHRRLRDRSALSPNREQERRVRRRIAQSRLAGRSLCHRHRLHG